MLGAEAGPSCIGRHPGAGAAGVGPRFLCCTEPGVMPRRRRIAISALTRCAVLALLLSLVRARTHRKEERDHRHHEAVPDHVLAALFVS